MYQTELDAFTVTSPQLQVMYPHERISLFRGTALWNPTWEKADLATARKSNIDMMLAKSPLYGLTPASVEKAFIKGSIR